MENTTVQSHDKVSVTIVVVVVVVCGSTAELNYI